MKNVDRSGFDECIRAMHTINGGELGYKYNFYGHLISQCRLIFEENSQSYGGVSFVNTHYNLYINPERFNKLSLEKRLGLLKHEMAHILGGHIMRRGDRDKELFNIAADCAINQEIEKSHLPDGGVTLEWFREKIGDPSVPELLSAEHYYDYLEGYASNQETIEMECDTTDDHGVWDESEGDPEYIREYTKIMVEKAISQNRGALPKNIEQILSIFTKKPSLSWQKLLRKTLGQKRINKKETIKRRDRRFPNRPEIRGVERDRLFDLIIVLDISGSMDNGAVENCLSEMKAMCKQCGAEPWLIQVDTEVHGLEKFNKNRKDFKRNASGGTILEPAWDFIRENKIRHDAIIWLTDGYCDDFSKWKSTPKCKNIVLTTDKMVDGVDGLRDFHQFKLNSK